MPAATPTPTARSAPFLFVHALLVPGAFALAAVAARSAGVDERISALFFDSIANTFPARASFTLELIGHRFAKSAVAGLWLILLAAAVAAPFVARLARVRALLWTTVVAMALGPSIVVLLKGMNALHCPWDLKRFGGYADFTSGWFVASIEAGRCFPSGHASGGFSLIALLFAGMALGSERLRALGLVATLVVGSAFSIVRIAQGAHFLSHNLWSAAIDWCAAALVFAPLMVSRQICRPQAPAATKIDQCGPELTPKADPKGLRRLPLAAAYALRGLRTAWNRESAWLCCCRSTEIAGDRPHQSRFTPGNDAGAGSWRPELALETLVLLASVFLVISLNEAFWRGALAGRSFGELWTWRFTGATSLALVALNFFAICLLATRSTVRVLLAVLIAISIITSHFLQGYGVLLDASMLRSVLNTDVREASEFLGADSIGAILVALLAAAIPWCVRVRRRTLRRALLIRAGALGVSLFVASGAMLVAFQDLSSLLRNNHSLRYAVTPGTIIWAFGQVLTDNARVMTAPPAPAEAAKRVLVAATSRKPTLFVMVLGETARAANFSLNGYARTTNPQLARLDIINFPHTTACGTSTEVSLPCIFSPFGRADYDAARIRRHESLLHLLARTGMRVLWLDNNTGCKGVCDGLEFHDVSREQISDLCTEGHCYDEVLLRRLAPIVSGPATDTVVILHQIGNHGPAYFRRYPPELRRFEPACESNELRHCTREQIVNAYDNAIAYTDRFLANVIQSLERAGTRFDVALLYVSDHGESLGELGLYLHGMPYAIAPREQLDVPMLWWIPRESARALDVNIDCLRNKATHHASHDNIYHTVLGLLAVDTPRYKNERDLFNTCRAGNANQRLAAHAEPQVP